MSEAGIVGLRAIVRGRVQGVGFRFFVRDAATALALRGYARNLADGTVEVVAEGSRASLEALLGELRRGPGLSRVDAVTESWDAASQGYTGFDIR